MQATHPSEVEKVYLELGYVGTKLHYEYNLIGHRDRHWAVSITENVLHIIDFVNTRVFR